MHGSDATRTNEETTEQPGDIRVTRYPRSVLSEQWVYIGKYGTYTDDLHSLVSPAGIPRPCSHRIVRCHNVAISHDTRSHLSKVTSLLRGETWSNFRGKGKKNWSKSNADAWRSPVDSDRCVRCSHVFFSSPLSHAKQLCESVLRLCGVAPAFLGRPSPRL